MERYEEILKSASAVASSSSATVNDPSISSTATSSTNNPSGAHNTAHQSDPTTSLDVPLKSRIYRQLGWLHFHSNELANKLGNNANPLTTPNKTSLFVTPLRFEFKSVPLLPIEKQQQQASTLSKIELNRKNLQKSLELLIKAAQLDPSNNSAWYCLGRAFTVKGQSREAFISFKNSVLNPDSDSSTWCSIGVLYYQQRQFMDALHAFVCSLQADSDHYESWLNLGILYEQDNQLEEALKCYKCAMRANEICLRKMNRTSCSEAYENSEKGNFALLSQIFIVFFFSSSNCQEREKSKGNFFSILVLLLFLFFFKLITFEHFLANLNHFLDHNSSYIKSSTSSPKMNLRT